MQKHQVAPRSPALPAETETRPKTQPEKRAREHEPPTLAVATERIIETSPATSSSKPADEIFVARTDRLATQPHAQAAIMEQLKQNYAEQIRERINQVKHYPLMARKRGREGVVTLEFSIDMQGKLLDSKILLSSGTKSLDQSALNALASAAPFDPPPVELKTRQSFQLQILFTLRD